MPPIESITPPLLKNLSVEEENNDNNNEHEACRSLVFSGTVHWFEGRQAFIHYCGLHQV